MDFDAIFDSVTPNLEDSWGHQHRSPGLQYCQDSVNRYKYVKSNITETAESSQHTMASQNSIQKILINPNFGKKVFVNPNFTQKTVSPENTCSNVIHVNTKIYNSKYLPEKTSSNVIHVNTKIYNPKFLQNNVESNLACFQKPSSPLNEQHKIHVNPNIIAKNAEYLNDVLQKRLLESNTISSKVEPKPECLPVISKFSVVRTSNVSNNIQPKTTVQPEYKMKSIPLSKNIKSRYKLVKSPAVISGSIKKRRNSVKSKYKIVKSSFSKPIVPKTEINTCKRSMIKFNLANKYKVDNRIEKSNTNKIVKKKFVYVNKFLSIGEIAKHTVIKKNPNIKMSVTNIKIEGVTYKKSPHSLKRTFSNESNVGKASKNSAKDNNKIKINRYKLVRKSSATKLGIDKKVVKKSRRLSERSFTVRKFKIVRKEKRSASPRKLRKCNIPCSFYKKYGVCKAHTIGKCFKKHDPDQIALCTKFLQGACIKDNCKLSHKVLPEKMPTCKYYLEGSCSKDNCQYLHVKINPKAEICRDFIEGFCARAAKCDLRHQYLCPDYEKHGKCPKQRCEYPHGNMVRNYLQNKNKFVKKRLVNKSNIEEKVNDKIKNNSEDKTAKVEVYKDSKSRYYEENEHAQSCSQNSTQDETKDFRSRPKLGELPAFIPFS